MAIRGAITHLAAGNPPVLQIGKWTATAKTFGVETA